MWQEQEPAISIGAMVRAFFLELIVINAPVLQMLLLFFVCDLFVDFLVWLNQPYGHSAYMMSTAYSDQLLQPNDTDDLSFYY